MNRAEEAALACALAESTTAFLHPNIRAWLWAKIGAGDSADAIRDLLTCYARSNAELPHEMATRVHTWILGYAGSDSEASLRALLSKVRTAAPKTAQPIPADLRRQCKPLVAASRYRRPSRV
jgi:hypothetical protein